MRFTYSRLASLLSGPALLACGDSGAGSSSPSPSYPEYQWASPTPVPEPDTSDLELETQMVAPTHSPPSTPVPLTQTQAPPTPVPATASLPPAVDGDGDGFFSSEDCDDLNGEVHPGVEEVSGNTVDEDCDGILEGVYQVEQVPATLGVFGSIQAAIDAAPEGALVVVGPGIWRESLHAGPRSLNISSREGPDLTTLKGLGDGTSILTIRGSEGGLSHISGLTFTGGSAVYGGGLYLENAQVEIHNCVFAGNQSEEPYQGCSLADDGETCQLQDPSPGWGGAAYIVGGSVTLSDVTFRDNAAMYGGGIYTEQTQLTLNHCLFDGNIGYMSVAVFSGSVPDDLTSPYGDQYSKWWVRGEGEGGALLLGEGTRAAIQDSTFIENQSPTGGGISHQGESLSISGLTSSGNFANHFIDAYGESYCSTWIRGTNRGSGGMLNLEGTTTISDSTFMHDVGVAGGAIRVGSHQVQISRSSFLGESVTSAEQLDEGWPDAACCSSCNGWDHGTGRGRGGVFAIEGGTLLASHIEAVETDARTGPAIYSVGEMELRHSALMDTDSGGYVFSTGRLLMSGVALTGGDGLDVLVQIEGDNFELAHVTLTGTYPYSSGTRPVNLQLNTQAPGCKVHSSVIALNGGIGVAGVFPPDVICYSDIYGNTGKDIDGELDGLEVFSAPPKFIGASGSVPYGGVIPVPGVGSPLINAGDPTILDRNGSRGDIGATGGPDGLDDDTDADGMGDLWEATYGCVVGADDGGTDPDQDGLDTLTEYNTGTSPTSSDTDLDGVSDSEELAAGTSPLEYFVPGPRPSEPGVAYVPDDVPTLEEAVARLGASGGHIRVRAGRYPVKLRLENFPFVIESVEGSESTILEPSTQGQPVVQAWRVLSDSLFQGFTLQGGSGSRGGAMVILEGARGIWRDLRLNDGQATSCGGAVWVASGASPMLEDIVVKNGHSQSSGGGLCVSTGGRATVLNGTFESCTADYGGAIYNAGELELRGAHVQGSTADFGGGVYNSGVLTLTQVDIGENHALAPSGYGGGVYNGASLRMEEVEIWHNTAYGSGGGVYTQGSITLNQVEIAQNSAPDGGGISLSFEGTVWGQGSRVYDNRATRGGGIFVADYAGGLVRGLDVSNNSAVDGGGIFVIGEYQVSLFEDLILDANIASNNGGGFIGWGCAPTLRHSIVRDNVAGVYGGGIFARCGSTLEQLHVEANTGFAGGGIYLTGTSEPHLVTQITTLNNHALGGLAGGLYMSAEATTIQSSVFAYNRGATGSENFFSKDFIPVMTHDTWWTDTGTAGVTSVTLDSSHLIVEPGLVPNDVRLSPTSPIISRGIGLNPDGTRSNPGAYGGYGADSWDLDNDGIPGWWDPLQGEGALGTDCDDLNPEVGVCQ